MCEEIEESECEAMTVPDELIEAQQGPSVKYGKCDDCGETSTLLDGKCNGCTKKYGNRFLK